MNLLWFLGDWRPSSQAIPGLWDYRSATFGDGILLPVAAYLLVASIHYFPPTPGETRLAVATFVMGALGGFMIQASWKLDPDPQLNWTIPAPQTFNFPGYYHAIFFIVCFGLFAAMILVLLLRVRAATQYYDEFDSEILKSPVVPLLLGCLTAFGMLVALDSLYLRNANPPRGLGSLTSLALVVVAFIAAIAGMRVSLGPKWLAGVVPGLIWGAFLAVAISFSVARFWMYPVYIGFTEALFLSCFILSMTLQLWIRMKELRFWWIRSIVLAGVLSGTLVLAASEVSSSLLAGSLVAICGFVAIYLTLPASSIGSLQQRQSALLSIATSLPLTLILLSHWLEGGGTDEIERDILLFIFSLLIPSLLYIGTQRFNLLWQDEDSLGPGPELEKAMRVLWIILFALFFTFVAGSIKVIYSSDGLLRIDLPTASSIGDLTGYGLAVASAISCGLALLAIPFARVPRPLHSFPQFPIQLRMQGSLRSALASAAAFGVWGVSPWVLTLSQWEGSIPLPVDAMQQSYLGWIITGAAILTGIWVGYSTYDSLAFNCASVEFVKRDLSGTIVCTFGGLTVGSTVTWLLLSGMWSHDGILTTRAVAAVSSIILVVNLILVILCGIALSRFMPRVGENPFYMALHHPVTNLLNDHAVETFFVAIWVFFNFIAARVLSELADPQRPLVSIITILPLLFLVPGFARGVNGAAEHHLGSELQRGMAIRATPIMIARAGGRLEAERLNEERVRVIRARFRRVIRVSHWLSILFVIVILGYSKQWLLRSDETAFTRCSKGGTCAAGA